GLSRATSEGATSKRWVPTSTSSASASGGRTTRSSSRPETTRASLLPASSPANGGRHQKPLTLPTNGRRLLPTRCSDTVIATWTSQSCRIDLAHARGVLHYRKEPMGRSAFPLL